MKLNWTIFSKNECLAICQYDARIFNPEILIEILETHPLAIIGTEVYENFYYLPPHEFFSENAPEKVLEHWKENLHWRKEIKTLWQKKKYFLKRFIIGLKII